MLPQVHVSRKRSSSKLSADLNTSPYIESLMRSEKYKSLTTIKTCSPGIIKRKFIDLEAQKSKDLKLTHVNISFEKSKHLSSKAEEIEEIYHDRLEKFKSGDSEYISVIEIIDSVYFEVLNHIKPFHDLMKSLRNQLEIQLYECAKEDLLRKIERVKKENSSLLMKINSLADINAKLEVENKKFSERNQELERILETNPSFILNYQNIVEKMIEQCQQIEDQKKEIKKLKKFELLYNEMINDLTNRSFLEKSIS